jgi:hypothetical protein
VRCEANRCLFPLCSTGKASDAAISSSAGSGSTGTNTDTGSNSSPDAGSAGRDAPQGSCTSATATPCTDLSAFTGTQVLDGNDDDFCNVSSFELIKFDMELNAADGVSTAGDAGPRDAQAIRSLGSDPGGSPCAGELFPYCGDRL